MGIGTITRETFAHSHADDTNPVPPGYKRTEAGLVPVDWEVVNLGSLVDFANGKPYEAQVRPSGQYYLITLDSIGVDGRLKSEHRRVDLLDHSLLRDDLVIILSDLAHGDLLGLCDVIPVDGRFVLNQRVGRLRLKIEANPQFVRLQINRRQCHFKKRGQGTSQRHIYKRDIEALSIPFPSKEEQCAIATVLRDVDELVTALDNLIAKKRAIKQEAMQQLLTGKIPLAGVHRGVDAQEIT